MTTRFTPDGDDIVVTGGKTFITNGDVADLILLFGKWTEIADGREGDLRADPRKGHAGPHACCARRTRSATAPRRPRRSPSTIAACRAPICSAGRARACRCCSPSLNKSRPSVAAHALGIARAAFEDAVAYINERRQSGRRIVEFQGIQFLLADLATDLAMCEAWLWHVARLVDSGVDDFGPEASMLKMRASDLAMRIATEAVQLHGGYGYMQGLPRRAADARRQDHPDLGRHQPDPPPADRPQLYRKAVRSEEAGFQKTGSGRPRRRQAASTVLRSRQAIVIGPTPPGTGVIAPAIPCASAKATSPTSFGFRLGVPSPRLMPTSMTDGARLDPVGRARIPAGRSRRPEYRRAGRCRGMSRLLEWASVTVQSSASSNAAIGLPTMLERPRTTASAPLSSGCAVAQQHQAALRRAGHQRR